MTEKSEQQAIEEFEEWYRTQDTGEFSKFMEMIRPPCRMAWVAAFRKYGKEGEE